jgi:hypothetical protein
LCISQPSVARTYLRIDIFQRLDRSGRWPASVDGAVGLLGALDFAIQQVSSVIAVRPKF